MSKIQEVLESGRAPGFSRGLTDADCSAAVKVPKALSEVENQPAYKHGPAIGARGITRHFGMSRDFIRRTWKMAALAALLMLPTLCRSGDITAGVTFSDGQTVHASDLNNLVSQATINSTFYTAKALVGTVAPSDYALFWSPSLGAFYRYPLSTLENQFGTNFIIGQPSGLPAAPDLFVFYSEANNTLYSVGLSNLMLSLNFGLVDPGATNLSGTNQVYTGNAGSNSGPTLYTLLSVPTWNAFQLHTAVSSTDSIPIYDAIDGTNRQLSVSNVVRYSFQSLDYPITGEYITTNHGLPGDPQQLQCFLVCISPELNYVVGDKIAVSQVLYNLGFPSTGPFLPPITYGSNATNVFFNVIKVGSNPDPGWVVNSKTLINTTGPIHTNNWVLRITASWLR